MRVCGGFAGVLFAGGLASLFVKFEYLAVACCAVIQVLPNGWSSRILSTLHGHLVIALNSPH